MREGRSAHHRVPFALACSFPLSLARYAPLLPRPPSPAARALHSRGQIAGTPEIKIQETAFLVQIVLELSESRFLVLHFGVLGSCAITVRTGHRAGR
eukprot:872532-Rhodomonas_salina.2